MAVSGWKPEYEKYIPGIDSNYALFEDGAYPYETGFIAAPEESGLYRQGQLGSRPNRQPVDAVPVQVAESSLAARGAATAAALISETLA